MRLNKITTTAAILTAVAAALFFISTPTQQQVAQAQTLEEVIQLANDAADTAEQFNPEGADAVRDALALLDGGI
jgi:hypothetical protein